MAQQHSHQATQRQHLPLSWKRHYIVSIPPCHSCGTASVLSSQNYSQISEEEEKKKYQANSSAEVLSSIQISGPFFWN